MDDTCLQCGRPGTDLLAADAERVRQSCRVCGAVLTSPTSRRLRSAENVPDVPDATDEPLAAYLPPDMLAWLRDKHGPDLPDAPDKAVMTAWHTAYDEFTARTAEDGDPRPPKFGKVVGALNAACFDVDLALGRLVPKGGDADREIARERAEHLLRWVAGPGRPDTWIATATAAPSPAAPSPAAPSPAGSAAAGAGAAGAGASGVDADVVEASEIEGILALPQLTDAVRAGGDRTLRRALFGVQKGPALADVVAHFGEEKVREALRAHASDGSRPLLAALTERLDAAAR